MAHITESSQVHKVQQALARQGVTHDSVVVANLSNVRVNSLGVLFFCEAQVNVLRVVQEGDGQPLPKRVTMLPTRFLIEGFYDLEGVRIRANGAIALAVPEKIIAK